MSRVIRRFIRAYGFSGFKMRQIIRWSFSHTEFSNYYYKISPRNLLHMNSTISLLGDIPYGKVENFSKEVLENSELRNHFDKFIKQNMGLRDSRIELGRRIFWYSLIRATKPKVVVETGISHGVGSCVIAQALLMNASEGFEGKAFGTEIDTSCGSMITYPWNNYYKVKFGDSITTLIDLEEIIDIFISDSNHDSSYEFEEYEVIKEKMSSNGIILADNAHASDALFNFSIKENRKFLFIPEKPLDHWYPGGGVGISIKGGLIKKFRD